jgi:hypothetical protein
VSISEERRFVRLVALLVGAVAATALWVGLVPWDLSEVDSAGRPLSDGGDGHGGAIALVAVVVTGAGVVLAASRRAGRAAARFVGGGLAAWAVLFAWRAGTAETSGANLFLAPLVVVVLPAAIAIPLAIGTLSSALRRRRSRLA